MESLKDLISKHELKLHIVKEIEGNKEWGTPNRGYKLKLCCGSKSYTFPFYQGYGVEHAPEINDVVDCLMSDSSVSESFEEFCSEFGYDTDSIKALKTHKACLEGRKNMQRLLGDSFEDFLYSDRN
jgi:hypothetical protein